MGEPGTRHLLVQSRELRTEGQQELFEAEVYVPADLVFFQGHFEGDPILPGVVQLDLAVLDLVEEAWPELEGALRGVLRLKFVAPLRPDDRIRVVLRRAEPGRVVFRIERGGRVCTSGILAFAPEGRS